MQQQAGATSWREGGCCCLSGLRLGVAFYCYPLGCTARGVNPLNSPEGRIVGRSRRVTMLGYRAYYFHPQAYATYASYQMKEIPSYE